MRGACRSYSSKTSTARTERSLNVYFTVVVETSVRVEGDSTGDLVSKGITLRCLSAGLELLQCEVRDEVSSKM